MHAKGVVCMLEKVLVMMVSNQFDDLAVSLHELGGRHVSYNVHPAHYSIVETALLRVLDGALGGTPHWNDDVKKGWAAVFKFVAKGMMNGAGSRLEITKKCRRMTEIDKSATLRLRVISRSEGTTKLLRRTKSASNLDKDVKDDRRNRSSSKRSSPNRSPKRSIGTSNSNEEGSTTTTTTASSRRRGDGGGLRRRGSIRKKSPPKNDIQSSSFSPTKNTSPTKNKKTSNSSKLNKYEDLDPDYERQIIISAMGEGRFAPCHSSFSRHYQHRRGSDGSIRSTKSLPVIPCDSSIILMDDDDDSSLSTDDVFVDLNDEDDDSVDVDDNNNGRGFNNSNDNLSTSSTVTTKSNDSLPTKPLRSSEVDWWEVVQDDMVTSSSDDEDSDDDHDNESNGFHGGKDHLCSKSYHSRSSITSMMSATSSSSICSDSGPPKLPTRH